MKNSYKVVVKTNQGNAKTVTHDVPAPGSWWGALKIKAVPGARYQLIDNTTGQGPDNIRVKRAGNDLRISFDGREDADLVISNYYEYTEPGFAALIGEADPGVFHAYLPESGQTSALVGNLPDGASNVGMALGGEQVGASGAAVGALVAVAGFNPLLAAPLALLGAGGGGGGGGTSGTGGGGDVTPPNQPKAKLHPQDDTGVRNDDGITSDNTPRLLIDADPDAVSAAVTINGKTYTTTRNDQGQFVVQIPDVDALGHGVHKYTVEVKDAAGNPSQSFPGSLTVLTDVQPPGNLELKSLKLTEDSGKYTDDFLTNKQELQFSGVVEGFDSDTQRFLVQVLNDAGDVLLMRYVDPADGQWVFDNRIQELGKDNETTPYLIKTSVVDLAGNILKSTSQSFVVDLERPELSYAPGNGSTGSPGQQTFTSISFSANEEGTFTSGAFAVSGNSVQLSSNSFTPEAFLLNFQDLAGNFEKEKLVNTGQTWNFQNTTVALTQGPSAGKFITLAGPVGQYSLGSNLDTLDVSSLYDTRPTAREKAAINHISTVGHGPDAITISMDDVLALGVKNSFTTSGKLQMRIDGDADDKVFLDNKMGTSSSLLWVEQPQSPGDQYIAYTNADLGLELFIQKGIQIQATGVL